MIVVCMAISIIVLDSSALNVAISKLVVELDTTLSVIQGIIVLYLLILGIFGELTTSIEAS
ncbi:MAG TPA: hypothetical protein PKI66_01725 [Methanobacteriaceae archaeon]|nr:hypothetical protein [Methanobacteriaceae archaeon]